VVKLRDRRTKLAQKKSPLLRKPNPQLQKKSLFVERRTALLRWRVRLQQNDRTARPPRPTALNQLIELEPLRFLQGELSLIRANPLSALPAARSSALSIGYPGHTRRWKVGGASAGSKMGLTVAAANSRRTRSQRRLGLPQLVTSFVLFVKFLRCECRLGAQNFRELASLRSFIPVTAGIPMKAFIAACVAIGVVWLVDAR
jgi:hypothetical protein